MPKEFQNYLQDFKFGVRSPRYAAAVEDDQFVHSVQEGRNFIISAQGGAAYREGMEFIGYGATQQPFRLFQFRRGGDVSDILIEVNAGQTRYWVEDDDGNMGLLVDNITQLTDEDTGDFLIDEDTGDFLTVGTVVTANPYTVADLDTLYFTNQAQYGILCHSNHPPTYITLSSNLTLTSEPFPLERIPEFVYNDYKSPQVVSQVGNWKLSFPAGWEVNGMIYTTTYNGVSGTSTFAFDRATAATNASQIQAQLTAAAQKQGYTTSFVVTAEDILNYTIDITGDNSGFDITVNPVMIYSYLPTALPPLAQANDDANTDPVAEPVWSYPFVLESDGFYFKCLLPHLATASDRPGNPMGATADIYWENLGAVKPVGYDYQNPQGLGWGAGNIYSPLDRGFPTVTVFHEQRLFFMANKDNPTSLYGSAIGQFFNFIPGPNDDEAVLFILESSDTPEIKWARSQRALILGTSSGEWSIGAQTTISASDIDAKKPENASRAKLNMAVQIDTEIFYIEQGGRKLRSTGYSRDKGGYVSANVSLMAENLVSTTGITRVVQSSIPETLLTMVTTDGRPLWFIYEKVAGAVAFTEGVTDGKVVDVVSFFSTATNQDYTYYAVERNGRYMLERMRFPTNKLANNFTANDVVFMDSWVSGTVVGNTITGLGNLEQKEVYVLVDDAWQIGTFQVVDGTITLPADETGKLYAVGLPYTGYLETFEIRDNVRGTGLGTKRRWNQLVTRTLNSSLPLIYDERAADRRPVIPMGSSDNVQAGIRDIKQSVSGYTDGKLIVTQDRPYPLYLMAFFGQYQVEDD